MSEIDVQNAKQIRDPMKIRCGITARASVDLTFAISGDVAAIDSNISTSLDAEAWGMRNLMDLSGDGFTVDGSCVPYDSTQIASADDLKAGIRSVPGGDFSIVVTAATEIPAITMYFKLGTGNIVCNNVSYSIERTVVIPVNDTTATLDIENTSDDRIELASIIPGIVVQWTEDTIISLTAALRSDLKMDNPTWQVSDLEIQAYYPNDISEAISNIEDDAPLWFQVGYDGDMSEVRNFYLSEVASMKDNIVTLKGEDASSKLNDKNNIAQVVNSTAGSGARQIYNRMVKYITDAGIKLVAQEDAPAKTSGSTAYTLIMDETTSAAAVSDIMNLSHYGNFWPVFVDAGIPKTTWSVPTAKWDIYEEDCGSVVREAARNIASIKSTGDYGLTSTATRNSKLQTIVTKSVTANKGYSHTPEGYWWYLKVTNAKSQLATASKIVWTAKKTTMKQSVKNSAGKTVSKTINQSVVTGKSVTLRKDNTIISHEDNRSGYTMEVNPIAHGRAYRGTTFCYPRYRNLFDRSNVTGSFTWKGDPRMQPQDVARFHRLDGTVELITIESLTMKFDGGMTADITYRKGIC